MKAPLEFDSGNKGLTSAFTGLVRPLSRDKIEHTQAGGVSLKSRLASAINLIFLGARKGDIRQVDFGAKEICRTNKERMLRGDSREGGRERIPHVDRKKLKSFSLPSCE